MEQIRRALGAAGLDSKPYSGHSFCIGTANTATREEVEVSTIKLLGRWRSSTYQLYIRTPREQLATISSQLVRGTKADMGHRED